MRVPKMFFAFVVVLMLGVIISCSRKNQNKSKQEFVFFDKITSFPKIPTEKIVSKMGNNGTLTIDKKGNFYFSPIMGKLSKFSETCHFVKDIGRIGHGPGEYSGFNQLNILNDKFYLSELNRQCLIVYDENGKFIENKNLGNKNFPYGKIYSFKDKFLYECIRAENSKKNEIKFVRKIIITDKEFKPETVLYSKELIPNKEHKLPNNLTYVANDDHAYLVDNAKQYKIISYDETGKQHTVFEKNVLNPQKNDIVKGIFVDKNYLWVFRENFNNSDNSDILN